MNGAGLAFRLGVLRENPGRLAEIPQATYAEFVADFRNVDSALHRLQTSIQALVDIAFYKLGKRGLTPPTTSREILVELESDKALPPGTANRFAPLFAFRNRVVHLYDRIDPQRVWEILTRHRQDLAALLELLLAIPD